jgi:hypothetical protein
MTAPTNVPVEDTLRRRIRALEIALAALTRRYGVPEAQIPPTVSLAIPQSELLANQHAQITTTMTEHDIEPEPFLLLTVQDN